MDLSFRGVGGRGVGISSKTLYLSFRWKVGDME